MSNVAGLQNSSLVSYNLCVAARAEGKAHEFTWPQLLHSMLLPSHPLLEQWTLFGLAGKGFQLILS